jgi:hypothetical protein
MTMLSLNIREYSLNIREGIAAIQGRYCCYTGKVLLLYREVPYIRNNQRISFLCVRLFTILIIGPPYGRGVYIDQFFFGISQVQLYGMGWINKSLIVTIKAAGNLKL